MDVLVEVHDEAELDRALALPGTMLGVNNRNLKTLAVDLATFERLAPRAPADRCWSPRAASYSHADLARMATAGARAFLVGESLMREPDVAAGDSPPARLGHRRMSGLTHIDAAGNAVMVDVTGKDVTERTATAEGRVTMAAATLERIAARGFKKGDVLGVAQLAGIMGAKRTADLIPLCHPLPLTAVTVELEPEPEQGCVVVRATCRVTGRTGVEMEALTAVAVAALTDLRHVQGGRPRHADHRPAPGPQERRPLRRVPGGGLRCLRSPRRRPASWPR